MHKKLAISMLAVGGLACATAPQPEPDTRMGRGQASDIKSRAARAHQGLDRRAAATTAKARREELKKPPQALDTLERHKPRPEFKPPVKKEIRKERPDWTKNPPGADGTYIYGLGSASYTDEASLGGAWTQARDRSYNEIGGQLKVEIRGRAQDYQAEFTQNGSSNAASSFSEAVTSHVDASLEGVELHDRYEDKKVVYVLSRFNKAELDAVMAARLEALKAEVLDRIEEAQAHLAKGDTPNALAASLRAAVARRNLFGMPISVGGKQVDAVIEGIVRTAAGMIRIEGAAPSGGQSGDRIEGVKISVMSNGRAADGVPIRFRLVGGAGFDNRVVATSSGAATLGAVRIFGSSPRIQAGIDLATLASVPDRENAWIKRQFGREVISLRSELDLALDARPVKVQGSLEGSMSDALSRKLGLVAGDGAWTLQINIDEGDCRDLSMRRTCSATASMTLTGDDGFVVHANRKVRGTAADDERAMAQVERRLPGALIKDFIRNLSGN